VRNKTHRVRYLRQRAAQWGHLHSGGEVVHKLTLERGDENKKGME
jgi:hypothetical protein